jgi:excisionase family DNA binding protein
MGDKKSFLTTGEVANYCGVTVRTVINWIQKGRLPAHQLPGARGDNRISRQDLLSFMSELDMSIPDELREKARGTVLVVDDEPAMLRAISRALRPIEAKTVTADSGFAAGVLFERERPRVMTLDLQMPGMSGIDLLEALDTKACKVIIVSGADQAQLDLARSKGVYAVFSKPFGNAELLACVRSALEE